MIPFAPAIPGEMALVAYLAFAAGAAFGILVRSRQPRYTCDTIGSEGAWA